MSPSQKKPLSLSLLSLSNSSMGGRPLAHPAAREGRSSVKNEARRSEGEEEVGEEEERAEAEVEAAVFFFG